MRFGFPNLVYATLFLSIGLGAGWWLRGAPEPALSPGAPADTDVQNHSEATTAPNPWPAGQEPAPSPERRQAQPQGAQPEPAAPIDGDANPDKVDLEEEFRALLAAKAFTAAMDFYQDVERRYGDLTTRLKGLVLEHLEHYLRIGDAEALTGLVDAFLSVYYDDIDVLLVLARYQQESDYIFEAARSFQLALSYSQTQATERRQVSTAFRRFVEDVDQRLAGQGQWRELTRFYETLEQLDLSQARDQLRLAELYLDHGDARYGRELLQGLTANSAVGAQASALLDGTQQTPAPSQAPTSRQPTAADVIALESVGSHYHLPLRLNDNLSVRLVIDTGASVTTLSRSRFEAIRQRGRFTELGPQVFNTAGGVSRGIMYRVDRLRLGNQVLTDVPIAVLDFDMPDGVDGLLGMNVLRHFRFQVDQDRDELHLEPR